ncbi:DUF551 domain-containing protein [Salmonella enterica subsp. enterica serovar Richmond]|nr:DUF551 domain-containing protein [Salmonella enterica subsp. enterica serovar Richmond]ECD3843100.1 DUF551 domain-containing protein [Salmonella enterica subsp. enterica serovar Richmond]EEH5602498.1 DUF551 domain-containing protein [Salmonella enterica subsp. enterica serovar Richmond]EJJ7789676.1 DUF551 domain-containing protein [Salmonella enterica]
MTTITNNKLPEWRTALDKYVENYQSTRAWYEENRDSPAALDDMERAEDQLANFVRKCGFSIVLGLLDEIDELQERRNADNQEPAGYHVIKECGKVGCSVATLEEAEKTRDFWNKKWTIRPYFYSAAPAPVIPGGWISCSERMPEETQPVIVVSEGGVVQRTVYQFCDGVWIDWYEQYDEVAPDAFTHWISLPVAPEKETGPCTK